jgi:peptidoglycan-N-acetylglucosamine deacetylase
MNTTSQATTSEQDSRPAPTSVLEQAQREPLPERAPPAPQTKARGGGGRDRYLDLLRAVALVRVVTYHTFGWAWLGLLFPSMGVMFALAGSLMARSLERPAVQVIRGRFRRLLPPFWLFGFFVVAAMLVHGWGPGPNDGAGAWWSRLAFWILPVNDPPTTEWAAQVTDPLWYIRTYLWLVILSPVLLPMFRRIPWATVAGFIGLAALTQSGLVPVPETLEHLESAVSDLASFGACWLLGFAHRDGLLDRMSRDLVAALAVATMAAGAWFAFTFQTEEGYDLGEIPLAQALWSFGFVLLLLRFRPSNVEWLRRVRPLDWLVSAFNARAVTVYLWHEVALVVSVVVIDLMWAVPLLEDTLPLSTTWFQYVVTWPLIVVAVVLFGWIEDVAARRRPRLRP